MPLFILSFWRADMTEASIALLERLRADGVIRPDQHAAALERRGVVSTESWSTLGEALLWLVDEGIVSDVDLDDIGEMTVSEAAFASNATRRQALDEMYALRERKLDERIRQARQAAYKAAFPGPRWAWLGGGAVAVVSAAWFVLAPASPPQCGDAGVQRTLRTSMFSTSVQHMARRASGGGPPPSDLLLATFTNVKEVGYIKAERSRGCSATLKVGDIAAPVAYIIGPNDKGDMMVSGANPRVVSVRYGQYGPAGKSQDVGRPAGATQLIAAFERGVAAFDERTQNAASREAFDRQRKRMGQSPDTDTRSVRNISPLGDCKGLGPDRWSCRLQAEFRDRLMSAIGKSDWVVIEGDFDFVRKGTAWMMDDNFARQYTDAIVRGRVAQMKGDEAAAKLEEIQRQRPGVAQGRGSVN